jgi:hypothetical protein
MAIVNQYAGNDKWEAEIKRQEQLLHTRVWKGQSNFSLEHFVSQHRNAFVSMQASAEHVQYQLPNEHSRVGFLLDAIQSSDAGLQAAMASVRTDNRPHGMRNNFEEAATHILPYDPVAKKRTIGLKRDAANISAVSETEEISATTGKKPSIGRTGVHLRYHKLHEYKALTSEQRDELREWRNKNPGNEKAGGTKAKAKKTLKPKTFTKKQVAAMVSKQVEEQLKKGTSETTDDGEAYLMSMVEAAVAKSVSNSEDNPSPKKVSLKSILKHVKNTPK